MKKLVLLLIVSILLYLSYKKNPTKEDFIRKAVSEYESKNLGVDNSVAGLTADFVGGIVESLVERNDFLIFSVYHLKIKNDLFSINVNVQAIGFWDNIFFF